MFWSLIVALVVVVVVEGSKVIERVRKTRQDERWGLQ